VPSPLIDATTLASLLGRDDIAVVDCRFDLADTAWGAADYARAHIPGAVYAHVDHDLSAPRTGTNGRHPLPDVAAARRTLGRLGIDAATHVVACDQESGMYASRLWWMLRWLGHSQVSVLDGGFAAWTAAGLPAASGIETRTARIFDGQPDPSMLASADEVRGLITDPATIIVDARAPERYRGDIEPIDPVAGHIPGAVNRFYQHNLDGGRFKTRAVLAAEWQPLLHGEPATHVVCYCGSGVTACHNLLALEVAGLAGARLYAGSWSEWVADPSRPIGKG
jgi:thiosulfate/3-mercaptopyruvate sulfurtransferase